MNIRHSLPSEQDDIVNSLNYEGIAVVVAVLPPADSDRLHVALHAD